MMMIIINVSAFRFFHTQTSYYLAMFVCMFQKAVLFLLSQFPNGLSVLKCRHVLVHHLNHNSPLETAASIFSSSHSK